MVDKADDFDAAVVMLPEFNRLFSVLEEDQAKASDMLGEWSQDLNKVSEGMNYLQMALLIVVLISFWVPIFANYSIFKPLRKTMGAMDELANGKYDIEVPYTQRKDEMGEIAKAVMVFKENAKRAVDLDAEQKEKDKLMLEERKKARIELANNFESAVKGVVDMVASAATEMEAASKSVASNA